MVMYRHVLSVLKKHNYNRTAAAKELGISYRGLYFLIGEMRHYGFNVPYNPKCAVNPQKGGKKCQYSA
jgi:molybdenum-dependent DNA-binding transcriptional regulator ModE